MRLKYTKLSLILFLLLSTFHINANEQEILTCLKYEWGIENETREDEYSVECAYQVDSGEIQLFPRFKAILKNKLASESMPHELLNTRSSGLFPAFVSSTSKRFGAAYFKPDGIGYHVVFYDNGPDYFKNGLSRYIANNKIGFINKAGEVVIKARFNFVSPFLDGYARYCINCKEEKHSEHTSTTSKQWYFIDKKGNTIIPPKLSSMGKNTRWDLLKDKPDCQTPCNTPEVRLGFKKLCNKSNSKACSAYGKLLGELIISDWSLGNRDVELSDVQLSSYLNYQGTDSNNRRLNTENFLEEHCYQLKNVESCAVLGIIEYGHDNKTRGLSLLQKACDQDLPWACNNLAYFKDLAFEHKQAQALYIKACQMGHTIACYNSGTSEFRNANFDNARLIFLNSCQKGLSDACNALKFEGET